MCVCVCVCVCCSCFNPSPIPPPCPPTPAHFEADSSSLSTASNPGFLYLPQSHICSTGYLPPSCFLSFCLDFIFPPHVTAIAPSLMPWTYSPVPQHHSISALSTQASHCISSFCPPLLCPRQLPPPISCLGLLSVSAWVIFQTDPSVGGFWVWLLSFQPPSMGAYLAPPEFQFGLFPSPPSCCEAAAIASGSQSLPGLSWLCGAVVKQEVLG